MRLVKIAGSLTRLAVLTALAPREHARRVRLLRRAPPGLLRTEASKPCHVTPRACRVTYLYAETPKVHNRMPVILNSSNVAMAWLNDDSRDTLDELMQPAANNALKFTTVSDYVNKSTNEGPECIEPADNQAA